MDTSIYSSNELREFREIMDEAIEEAHQRGPRHAAGRHGPAPVRCRADG